MIEVKSREEHFAESVFEWVKSERVGDVCKFERFEVEESSGIEYVIFTDSTRVNSALIGDVVLRHLDESFLIGRDASTALLPTNPQLSLNRNTEHFLYGTSKNTEKIVEDPVSSLLKKSKKKVEKISLALSVKIPSTELYSVLIENFKNADEIIVDSIIDQIQKKILRESIKKELQNIYFTKKK